MGRPRQIKEVECAVDAACWPLRIERLCEQPHNALADRNRSVVVRLARIEDSRRDARPEVHHAVLRPPIKQRLELADAQAARKRNVPVEAGDEAMAHIEIGIALVYGWIESTLKSEQSPTDAREQVRIAES